MNNNINEEERIGCTKELNDHFRKNPLARNFITPGIKGNGSDFIAKVITKVQTFNNFTEDNDPHGEHDFGSFNLDGEKVFWKIDYYDLDMKLHSREEANPIVTNRVLTIMLASEY